MLKKARGGGVSGEEVVNHPHGRLYLAFKYGFVTILLWLLSETILAH